MTDTPNASTITSSFPVPEQGMKQVEQLHISESPVAEQSEKHLDNSAAPTAPKVIAIVGAGGDGKSTLTNALASIVHLKGRSVTLFDGDPANSLVRAAFKIPEERTLQDGDEQSMEQFLETQVYHPNASGTHIVDFGANQEAEFLRWLLGRGDQMVTLTHFLIVIGKKDGVYTASRVLENTKAPALLVLNEREPRVIEQIENSRDFALLTQKAAGHILIRNGKTSVLKAHLAGERFHDMAASGSIFDAAGMLSFLRDVEAAFAPFPEFTPWA